MFKKIPHTYTIIFLLIILAAILTWCVPAGEFDRISAPSESGKTYQRVDPDSFHAVDAEPQSWQIFSAFFKGFQRAPGIIAFILILGGAFWIINESKAIDMGVQIFLQKCQRLERYAFFRRVGTNPLILAAIMLLFSFFGATFGMSEETMAFVIIFVPLAISMGYDSIVGVNLCFVAAALGFGACMLNPFNLGIAQDIAGLPLFSGLEYRVIIWLVITTVGITYSLCYAAKVKRNPQRSLVYKEDQYWRDQKESAAQLSPSESLPSTHRVYYLLSLLLAGSFVYYSMLHFAASSPAWGTWIAFGVLLLSFVGLGYRMLKASLQMFALHLLLFCVAFLVLGVMGFEWGFSEIAALFFAFGLLTGWALGHSADAIIKLFMSGARDMLGAALVVGLAGGIIVILEDGRIIDTLLHGAAQAMRGDSELGALSLMYGFQTLFNALITSGTAKAAMLMPIFSEIAQMIGVSLQSTVTAFHLGDGFTNLITPTSGVLIGVLEIARIPYTKWIKWAWKLALVLVVAGFLMLIPTLFIW